MKKLFEDKKKRYITLSIIILLILLVIGFLGFNAYKDVKSILSLAGGDTTTEVKDENKIESMGYVLRDNATDLQKECFKELKEGLENHTITDEDAAGMVAKNFIADFFTWTNKYSQYDVGGMEYVFEDQKNTVYIQARDGFYKYLTNYINEYGAKNLIEVDSIEVTSSKAIDGGYPISVRTNVYLGDDGLWREEFEDIYFDAWYVNVNWTYKEGSKVDNSKFAKSMNFVVIIYEGKYQITEMSEKTIDLNFGVEVIEDTEGGANNED